MDKGKREALTAKLLAQEKTNKVLSKIIRLNDGLMYKQLNKFYLADDPDAISLAYEALYDAIMTYDSNKSSKFSTYATVCIYNALGSHVRKLNTGLNANTISYDQPIGDSNRTLLDTIESNYTADGEMLSECGVKVIGKAIVDAHATFQNPLHKEILTVWIASDFKIPHTTIGEKLGCSQTYVSQTIKKFKEQLKMELEES